MGKPRPGENGRMDTAAVAEQASWKACAEERRGFDRKSWPPLFTARARLRPLGIRIGMLDACRPLLEDGQASSGRFACFNNAYMRTEGGQEMEYYNPIIPGFIPIPASAGWETIIIL